MKHEMSYSLNSLKRGLYRELLGVMKGDTRSLDNSSNGYHCFTV